MGRKKNGNKNPRRKQKGSGGGSSLQQQQAPAPRQAAGMKDEGNQKFAAGKYREAIQSYEKSVVLFEQQSNGNDEEKKSQKVQELSKVWANTAECHLRLQEPQDTLVCCAISLALNKDNAKAMYRQARAKFELHDYRGAMEDGLKCGVNEGESLAAKARGKFLLYRPIIDSYRLRMEEQFTEMGSIDAGSIYADGIEIPEKHFRAYMRLGLLRKAFHKKFTLYDIDAVVEMAKEEKWHNIRYAVKLEAIKSYYADQGCPLEYQKLRELAVKVMGEIGLGDSFALNDYASDAGSYDSDSSGSALKFVYDDNDGIIGFVHDSDDSYASDDS